MTSTNLIYGKLATKSSLESQKSSIVNIQEMIAKATLIFRIKKLFS